ncbi:hypothetical protein [Candidatus Scalindua japonica]|uniref:hypothetical protein n=1 Tax=Candidatus Scalindua japonica TaxID=1284222 RepID=UPI000BDED4E2|nr:hypothetical protein [Candidatus Scalindua japonica]
MLPLGGRHSYPLIGVTPKPPALQVDSLLNLSNHHIYLKLMIDGITSRPFSATCLPPPERDVSHKEGVINLSRKRYGRKREEVEKEVIFKDDIKTESKTTQESLFS